MTNRRELDLSIGLAVKTARAASGFTLKELSDASGVSAAMISKIERGRVSASVATLHALALACRVPIANFFADTIERKEVCFVPAGQGIHVQRSGSTYSHSYRLVGRVTANKLEFEAFLIELEDSAAGEPLLQHGGIEFIYVIEGEFTYISGGNRIELAPGDCLSFETETPHGPVELKSSRVVILTAVARRNA